MKDKLIWKDTTAYARWDGTKRTPTTWTTEIADLTITVTCSHIRYKGQWVMHCFGIGMDTVPTDASSAEAAQRIALDMVFSKVLDWYNALSEVR